MNGLRGLVADPAVRTAVRAPAVSSAAPGVPLVYPQCEGPLVRSRIGIPTQDVGFGPLQVRAVAQNVELEGLHAPALLHPSKECVGVRGDQLVEDRDLPWRTTKWKPVSFFIVTVLYCT